MYLDELNQKQFEAVTTNEKKVLVMAGAGSGKTKVLTNRIRYLIDNGESEYNVVAFTFTNKAALEMKNRLNKDMQREIKSFIGTFHSFCYSYIRDFYYVLGFEYKPDVIDDVESGKILREIIDKYDKKLSTTPFKKAISRMKNKSKIDDIKDVDLLLLNSIYHDYQDKLKASSVIDFDDMIPLFIELYHKDQNVQDLCSFKYILVDECQDTNEVQFELINTLSEYNNNIFMVGDEDQLIYSFRNSTIEIINNFKNEAHVIVLDINYRCHDVILKKANILISHNANRMKKDLSSVIKDGLGIKYKHFDAQIQEAKDVAETILKIQNNNNTIAILYRNNRQSFMIEKELNKAKIPYKIYKDNSMFNETIIIGLINTIRLLFNPKNEISFKLMYNAPNNHIEISEYNQFIHDYHLQNKDLIEYSSIYLNPKIRTLGTRLKQLKDNLDTYQDSKHFLTDLLEIMHYYGYFKEYKSRNAEYDLVVDFESMIKDVAVKDLYDFLNDIYLENNINDKEVNTKVSLMTIHKAKGLEFDTVFVIGCNQEIIPGPTAKKDIIEEERRLFYVAMTRARKCLYLYSSTINFISGQVKYHKPSQFIIEADIDIATKLNNFFGKYHNNR